MEKAGGGPPFRSTSRTVQVGPVLRCPWVPLISCPWLLSGASEQAFSPFPDSGNTIHPPHTYVLGLDYMQTSCQVLGWKSGHGEHKPSLTELPGTTGGKG